MLAAVELGLGGLVEVGSELGEGRQFAELRHVQAQLARHLFHGLGLRSPPTRETEMPTFTAGRMPA